MQIVGLSPFAQLVACIGLVSVALLASTPAAAAVYDLNPGAAGKDTSPYAFIPSLVRGNYETMYAQTAVDESQLSHDQITYLEFELPPGLLEPGETVVAASLFMVFSFTFSHDGTPPPPGGALYVHEVSEAWDEQTMSWNDRPAHGPAIAEKLDIEGFGAIEFDVTQSVRGWAHGLDANHGFAVTNPSDVSIGFHSWESIADVSLQNHLVIVTGPGAPPVAVLSTVASLGLAAGLGALGMSRLWAQPPSL